MEKDVRPPTSNLLKQENPYLLFYLDKSHFEKQFN